MTTRRLLTALFGIGVLGALSSGSALAQSEWLPDDATPIQEQFIDELGTTFVEYWNPRLNGYKRTIDRTLSPSDLRKLNELRVRWSILMDEIRQEMEVKAKFRDEDRHEELEIDEFEDDDVQVKMGLGAGSDERIMELFEIWTGTTLLARNYRSGLDNLSEVVLEDAGMFGDEVAVFVNRFAEHNRSDLKTDEKGAMLLEGKDELAEGIQKLKNILDNKNESVMKAYSLVVEPVIMLFNGGDMRDMLPVNAGNVSSVGTQVAGLLPESAVLHQNAPNPASTYTTIGYTLGESSEATTLRVFASDGSMISSADLGSLPKGPGSYKLDVSELSNGSYLYHLTVMTSAGEMVYSKVMQIVR